MTNNIILSLLVVQLFIVLTLLVVELRANVNHCQQLRNGTMYYGKCYVATSGSTDLGSTTTGTECHTPLFTFDGRIQVEHESENQFLFEKFGESWTQYAFENGEWRWRDGQRAKYTPENWRVGFTPTGSESYYPSMYALQPNQSSVFISGQSYFDESDPSIARSQVCEVKYDDYCHRMNSHFINGKCVRWEMKQFESNGPYDQSVQCPSGFTHLIRPRSKKEIQLLVELMKNDKSLSNNGGGSNETIFITDLTVNEKGDGYVYSDGSVPSFIEGLSLHPSMPGNSNNGSMIVIDVVNHQLVMLTSNDSSYNDVPYVVCEHMPSQDCNSLNAYYYRGSCYRNIVSRTVPSWEQAVYYCMSLGFDRLALLKDERTYGFLSGIIEPLMNGSAVIDGRYNGTMFVNEMGEPVPFVSTIEATTFNEGDLIAIDASSDVPHFVVVPGTGDFSSFVCERELTCFGRSSSDPNVCSGRGTCISRDRCACDSNSFIGDECQARKRYVSEGHDVELYMLPTSIGFIVTKSNNIYAISETEGYKIWFDSNGLTFDLIMGTKGRDVIRVQSLSHIALVEGEKVVVVDSQKAILIDMETMSVESEYDIGTVEKITAKNDTLYFTDSIGGSVWQLNLKTSAVTLFMAVPYDIEHIEATSTTLVVSTMDDIVLKYDIATKQLISRFQMSAFITSLTVSHVDDSIYVSTADYQVSQLTTSDQVISWTSSQLDQKVALDMGLTSDGNYLYALSAPNVFSIVPLNCERGYGGQYCFNPICFGVLSDNSAACSGSGTCIAPDHCICQNDSTNRDCSEVKKERMEIKLLTNNTVAPTSGASVYVNGHNLILFCDSSADILQFNRSSSQVSTFMTYSPGCDLLVTSGDQKSLIVVRRNYVIEMIDLLSRSIVTLAGMPDVFGLVDGFVGESLINSVQSLAVDPYNADVVIFVQNDSGANTIRRLDISLVRTTTISSPTRSNSPYKTTQNTMFIIPDSMRGGDRLGVQFFAGKLLITSTNNNGILLVDISAMTYQVKAGWNIGGDTNGFIKDIVMDQPIHMSVNELTGDVYIVYNQRGVIKRLTINDMYDTLAGEYDRKQTQIFDGIRSTYYDATRNSLIVFGETGNAIHEIELSSDVTCYGISYQASNVCSSHGTCVATDQCQCSNSYGGSQCDIPKCYGILSNETSSVCHGRGQCLGPNFCYCNSNYTGSTCQYPKCFGKGSNDMQVCSSHGTCYAPDRCNCSSGYTGSNCSIPLCDGYSNADSAHVCSGHGSCVSPNTCQCFNGYIGNKCSVVQCHGINSTDITVCSGHGTCVGGDTCMCNDMYYGLNCENHNTTQTPSVTISETSPQSYWITGRTYRLRAVLSNYAGKSSIYYWTCTQSTGASCGTQNGINSTFSFSKADNVSISVNVKLDSGADVTASFQKSVFTAVPFSTSSAPFLVTPKNGTSFDTKFNFTATGWQAYGGAVLTYSYEYYDSDSKIWRSLYTGSSTSYRTQMISQKANSTIHTALRVRTNYGDEKVTYYDITVNSRVISSAELNNQLSSTNWTAMSDADKASTLLTFGAAYAQSNSTSPELADGLLNTISSVHNVSSTVATQLINTLGLLSGKAASLTAAQKPKLLGSLKSMLKSVDLASGGNAVLTTAGQSISNVIMSSSQGGADEEQLAKDGVETMRAITSCIMNSVEPGSDPIIVDVEAFSLSVQKVFSDAMSPNVSTSDDMSIGIPQLNLTDSTYGLEYTAYNDVTGNVIWKKSLSDYATNNENSAVSSEIFSSVITFRVLSGTEKVAIETSNDAPLVITLKKTNMNDTLRANQTTVCHYFDDQKENEWETGGCWLQYETETTIVCNCNHTTSFAAFIQYSKSELSKDDTKLDRGIYIVAIVFNAFFIIVVSSLLLFLLYHRNKQPIRSRIYAPVICLIALLVECCLQGILRNALLAGKDRARLVYPINVIGSIILIISCPLSIISLFVFFWQNIRQFILKHFYYLMNIRQGKAVNVVMKASAIISSRPLFYVNIGVIWSVLFAYFLSIGIAGGVKSAQSTKNATIITITSSVTYLALLCLVGVGIVLTFLYDFVIVFLQERDRFNNVSPDQNAGKNKKFWTDIAWLRRLTNVLPSFLYSHLVSNDPLFFRIDSILITSAVMVGFISFCAGIAAESTMKKSNSPARIVFLIFDIMYTILRIAAFGGGIAIIRIVQMIKERRAGDRATLGSVSTFNSDKDNEIIAIVKSKQTHFREYCIKEQSLENLLAMIEILDLLEQWDKCTVNEKQAKLDYFYSNFISYEGVHTLNISGKNRKSFSKLRNSISHDPLPDQLGELRALQTAIMTNLSDTFSRYTDTTEYSFLVKQQAMHVRLENVDLDISP